MRKATPKKREPLVRDTRDYYVTQPVEDPLASQKEKLQQGLTVNGVRYTLTPLKKD
ncbi:hypothetical protein [Chitinimonas sp.]|uniref:hypothetical protein n=1 Tax=Chitinimonas sp. TaxID=1934313 RepID=UPI002F93943D